MKVLICDDHALFAEAMAAVLTARGHEVVGCVTSPEAALRAARETHVDICVMDLTFPSGSGIDGTATIVRASPHTRVVVLTGSSSASDMTEAVHAGARGIVTKGDDVERVLDTLERVHDGELVIGTRYEGARSAPSSSSTGAGFIARFLTLREREVLEHLAQGKSTAELARALGVKSSTARTHIQNTLNKLGVHSKLEAVIYAVTNGLVPSPAAQERTKKAT